MAMATGDEPVYTTEALARAMAPVRTVIDSFFVNHVGDSEETLSSRGDGDGGIRSQGQFVSLLLAIAHQNNDGDDNLDWASIDLLPSRRYVHKLVQWYTSKLEECNIELENDDLAELVCHLSTSRCNTILPDPTSSCIVSFRIPLSTNFHNNNDLNDNDLNDNDLDVDGLQQPQLQSLGTNKATEDDILRIRMYPHHNDVGVAKVWEAGACLAEYLIYNPHCVRDRNVVELGAGVGFTGLIAAGVSKAKSVHMTDYTEVCLDNLVHNIQENGRWLVGRDVCPGTVTAGKLMWEEYSKNQDDGGNALDAKGHVLGHPWEDSMKALSKADVLLAADVVYDISCIPDLVGTVYKFLDMAVESDEMVERVAIFATTYRNKNTFALFETELDAKNIICKYYSTNDLPTIFPCYFNQPRSDVRVCTMQMKKAVR